MVFNPLAGKFGSVTVEGVPFAFDKWKISMKSGLPKVNNFTSAFQQLVAGLTSGTVTLSGPYDAGNMPFEVGESYAFTLAVNDSISWIVTCLIESLDPEDDVEDAARISITAQSSGEFDASIT